ncbi:MAG: anaerobic ribonucleoside-triphosphate reductase [Clostridia bacterium]|nr:anaerobic ribonucleoside-triphosphate reductase [Clostridia bacterium]
MAFRTVFLFLVIRWAIDGSETADNIREIRSILSQGSNIHPEAKQFKESEPCDKTGGLNISIDQCPACGNKLSDSQEECPACGLTIK